MLLIGWNFVLLGETWPWLFIVFLIEVDRLAVLKWRRSIISCAGCMNWCNLCSFWLSNNILFKLFFLCQPYKLLQLRFYLNLPIILYWGRWFWLQFWTSVIILTNSYVTTSCSYPLIFSSYHLCFICTYVTIPFFSCFYVTIPFLLQFLYSNFIQLVTWKEVFFFNM